MPIMILVTLVVNLREGKIDSLVCCWQFFLILKDTKCAVAENIVFIHNTGRRPTRTIASKKKNPLTLKCFN